MYIHEDQKLVQILHWMIHWWVILSPAGYTVGLNREFHCKTTTNQNRQVINEHRNYNLNLLGE